MDVWTDKLGAIHNAASLRDGGLHITVVIYTTIAISTVTLCCYSPLLLTLCGLTSLKTHRGGLGPSRSVHKEAYLCFLYFA